MVNGNRVLGCCGSMMAVGLLLTAFWVLFRAGKSRWEMDCPECDGGERRSWGPCPTCGPEDKIDVRGNGVPRGTGVKGEYGPMLAKNVRTVYESGRRSR